MERVDNLEHGDDKKLKYRGRVFKKDVPEHEELLDLGNGIHYIV